MSHQIRIALVVAGTFGVSGCSLSKALVEWQVDSKIDEFVDEVDPPSSSRVVLELLADDVKTTIYDVLYDASDAATAVQAELENPEPKMLVVRARIHGLLDEIQGLPIPVYLARLAAWYGRLDPASRARFSGAIEKRAKKNESDDQNNASKKKEREEGRAKRHKELMDRFELDETQRRQVRTLLVQSDEEGKASEAEWKERRKPIDQELAKPSPDEKILLELAVDAWSKIDFDQWKKTLDRWLTFYESLRPDQKTKVHAHFREQLDDLPRFER